MSMRSALYVDGFNFYHAVDQLKQPHLKWLDLWRLGELLTANRSEQLVRVVWCTAIKTADTDKMLRHRLYRKALRMRGVECLEGHFADEQRQCRSCGNHWMAPTEKQGDVNLALACLDDAYRDIFDHAYLLTADGDQTATFKLLKSRFPSKLLTTVAPPNRSHSKHILAFAHAHQTIGIERLERAVFPRAVSANGEAVVRPPAYDPPVGWVHPDDRPSKPPRQISN